MRDHFFSFGMKQAPRLSTVPCLSSASGYFVLTFEVFSQGLMAAWLGDGNNGVHFG